jgi:hypothetical protein
LEPRLIVKAPAIGQRSVATRKDSGRAGLIAGFIGA